jgi:malonyl CoA-acyl carrier protein transacylase/phosphopantetheinyl transferase
VNRTASEIFLIGAPTRSDLLQRLRSERAAVDGASDTAASPAASTVAIVSSSREDLDRKLVFARERLEDDRCTRIKEHDGVYWFDRPLGREGKLAFLFPGEGSQYPNMLADLCMRFPEVRAWFDLIDRVAVGRGRGQLPSQSIFPAVAPVNGGNPDDLLWQMDHGSESVFAADQALSALLAVFGVRPAVVAGHSTGEYSALLAAGAVAVPDEEAIAANIADLNDLYEKEHARGRIPHGVLLAAGGVERDRVVAAVEACANGARVAMDNCPHQTVVCACGDVEATSAALRACGAVVTPLPFERAYHTKLFEDFCAPLRAYFGRLDVRRPELELYSCITAAPFPSDPDAIRDLAASQYARPVRFRETVEAMHDAGVRIFVEVGPRANLTGFVVDTLRARPHAAVATNVPHRSGLEQLQHALAQLAAHGIPLGLDRLCEIRRLDSAAGVENGSPRAPVALSLSLPVMSLLQTRDRPAAASPPPQPPGSTARAAAVERHLELMERFLGAQREVLAAYLGGVPTGAPADVGEVLPPVSAPPSPPPNPEEARRPGLPAAAGEDLLETLLRLAAERTGYPADMLDPTLDLEADLGIDSIKRVEILGALQRETGALPEERMDELLRLRTLAAIADVAASAAPAAAAAEAVTERSLPLVDEVVFRAPDEVVVERRFDVGDDVFLRDHALGGEVSSRRPELHALPVMPLTMSLEHLAEAAALVAPGLVVVGFERVEARRWITFESGAATLRVAARREPEREDGVVAVHAHLVATDPAAGEEPETGEPAVSAVVQLAPVYSEAPPADESPLSGERASQWSADRLYTDGMFTGPAFRGVASVDACADDGATATLRIPPVSGLFRSRTAEFVTDPVLLDAAGQVVGFWAAERLASGFVVFPFAADRITLYRRRLDEGELARCRARITLDGEDVIRSDIEIAGGNGRAIARIEGWQDKRFAFSRELRRFVLAPRETMITSEWDGPVESLAAGGDVVCRRVDALGATAEGAAAGIWQQALAFLILGEEERRRWLDLPAVGRRRLDWLLGRLAAKEAVRLYLHHSHGLDVACADVDIAADERGRPIASGPWTEGLESTPAVSIAHSNGTAVALAGGTADRVGLGIDIETVRRRADELGAVAFTPAEQGLLDALDNDARKEWALRLWCAKEAVGKALGTGLAQGPRGIVVRSIDPASGSATVEAAGADVVAHTAREGELVVATAMVEVSA